MSSFLMKKVAKCNVVYLDWILEQNKDMSEKLVQPK